jgi:hypothetical protein
MKKHFWIALSGISLITLGMFMAAHGYTPWNYGASFIGGALLGLICKDD